MSVQVVVVMRERLTTEGGGTRTICQGRGRVHAPFVTHTNEVEIRFYTKKRAEEQAYFLIGYEGKSPDTSELIQA